MRQVFSSPRLENVEGVARLLEEAGIETKVTEARGYKQVSRREFSYVEKTREGSNAPAVWVIKSDDYKRAREMLHGIGLLETTPPPSYVPEALQFKSAAPVSRLKQVSRIRIALLFVVGALGAWMLIRAAFLG